jgi:SAM-dependent methyltransferase
MSEKAKYENRNPIHRYLLQRFLASAARAVLTTGRTKIVDVGCADGYVYRYLRDHSGIAFDYVGYDIDHLAITQAKRGFPGIPFREASIYDLKVNTELVLCMQVLEHLNAPERAVKQLASMNADYFVVSVPHEPWFALGNLARGRHIRRLGSLPGHINHWTKRSFAELLGRHFEIVGDFSSFPWIMHLLCKPAPVARRRHLGVPVARRTRFSNKRGLDRNKSASASDESRRQKREQDAQE